MAKRAAALVLFVLMALLTGGPAFAHGGPIKLEVSGDGGQGVNTTVRYVNDNHMVTDEVVLSYTGVNTANGTTIGPVRLIASAEGQGFYTSEKPLPLGDWTVTVTATHPSAAQQTVAVRSAALPQAPASEAIDDSPSWTFVILSVAVAAVVLAGVALLLRRRVAGRR